MQGRREEGREKEDEEKEREKEKEDEREKKRERERKFCRIYSPLPENTNTILQHNKTTVLCAWNCRKIQVMIMYQSVLYI